MRNKSGYVFEDNGKWYARLSFKDSTGKTINIKRTANSKSEAKALLKQLTRIVDDEGEKVVQYWKLTFNDLADYCEKNYAIPAKYVEGQKIEGLRELTSIKYYLKCYQVMRV